jgi:fumarate hydratase subunit alpha
MRELHIDQITEAIAELSQDTNFYLGEDVIDKVKEMKSKEESKVAHSVLNILLANYDKAASHRMPICQDTGISIVFLEVGQDLHIVGGDLTQAVNEGIAIGYAEGYLRNSIVDDPIYSRKNTRDNTPAVIHTSIVPGNKLKITFAPKGGGAENMSQLKMMTPAAGLEGIKNFVMDTVKNAGPNACPPIIVGIGVGGSFEHCAYLAKKSLMRDLNTPNPDSRLGELEEELLEQINEIGIGPQGLGGKTTALAVRILAEPCHIASMPVAINIQCHASRHGSIIL